MNAFFGSGFAFCEYVDPNVTDIACAGLNGMPLGDRKLTVQRASVGSKMGAMAEAGAMPPQMPMGKAVGPSVQLQVPGVENVMQVSAGAATEVLCLMNMVIEEELRDPDEYDDLLDDIRRECAKYGALRSIEIPRPIPGVEVPGVGRVFLEYESVQDAVNASQHLSGRKFANRVVLTSYYDPDKYNRREF